MRILLAVDNSPFAEAAVGAVISQFSGLEHEVRVFHAADWEQHLPASFLFAEGPHAAQSVLAYRDETLREAGTYVNAVATKLRSAGFAVTTEISPQGDTSSEILDAAGRWPADLIVVGSHGRSGLGRFFLGSVSERVVRHAPCSVEVVRRT